MPTPARITYIDATDGPTGNTQLAIGEVLTAKGSPLIGNDDLWSKRPEGNGGSVFTTNDGRPSGPEDGPELVTTITQLTPGSRYRVYAYFWTDHNNWQLKASLTPISPPGNEAAVSFSKNGTPTGKAARTASAADFLAPVIVTEANRQLLQAELGDAVADVNGEIQVWIDDFANSGHSTRTWYDGVGILPISSPSVSRNAVLQAVAIVLIAAAIVYTAASILRNRRRKQEGAANGE